MLAIFVLAVVVVIDVVVVVIDDVVVDRNSRSSNFRPKRLKKGEGFEFESQQTNYLDTEEERNGFFLH